MAAAGTSSPPTSSNASKRKVKRKRFQSNPEAERFDSLAWSSSVSSDDRFAMLVGSNQLDGGFLSLEEIDEAEYCFDIPKPEAESKKGKAKEAVKSKKIEHANVDGGTGDAIQAAEVEEKMEIGDREENAMNNEKKKKKKKKGKKAPVVEQQVTAFADDRPTTRARVKS